MSRPDLTAETAARLERATARVAERTRAANLPRVDGGGYLAKGDDRRFAFSGTDLDVDILEEAGRQMASDGISALRGGGVDPMQVLAGLWVHGLEVGIALAEQDRTP